ncbi:PKD domain-containing protein [Halorarius halobius]|uniref:PKD domain-containing protein n=1 Tax=Halorarius halobius TaxID=2962671 RepID=UPI0020CF3B14|nr:PKD domain-containing protein [Halorarius halobius]
MDDLPRDLSAPSDGSTTLGSDGSFSLAKLNHALSAESMTRASVARSSGQPTERWNRTFGGSQASEGQAVATTDAGGYVVAGYATADGNRDGQLVKVSSDGTTVWSHTYGGSGDERAYDVTPTSDGGYVMAGVTRPNGVHSDGGRDMWLVKVDGSGDRVWTQTFGGPVADHAQSVIETADGGYAVAGWTNSTGAARKNVWLVKVDSTGTKEFARTYGGSGVDKGQALVQTADGGFAIAGWTNSSGSGQDDMFLVRTTSSGDKQWSKTYGGEWNEGVFSHGLTTTSDGGFALAGWTETFSIGADDMWLVKVDSTGTKQWSNAYGRSLNDVATSVIQTADGGYALSGYTRTYDGDGYDSWLIKTGSEGAEQWNLTFGGGGTDVGTDLVQTDGGYTFAGYTSSYGSGSYDTWLVTTGESTGPPPTIDAKSVELTPYPVEQGTDPTLQVAVANANEVDVRVSLPESGRSTRARMAHTTGDQYRLDLGSVGLLDGLSPGTEVDLEIVATSEAGQARLGSFLRDADRTRFLTTNPDLDYYVFRDVKEVAVVMGTFSGQSPPADLRDPTALQLWETSMELDANNYFGSGRGSMGAIGFDFTYLDNDSQFYTLPHEEVYYGNRADPAWIYNARRYQRMDVCPNGQGSVTVGKCGAHVFLEDLKSTSGLDPSEYHSWIGTHGGMSIGNPKANDDLAGDDNRYTGVHFFPDFADSNEERTYAPIGRGITTLLHELGHGTPMKFAHPTNKNDRVSLMGYQKQFSPTGEREIPPVSPVHRLGLIRSWDPSQPIDWLEPRRTFLTANDVEQTELEVKALRSYDLGDEVPVVQVVSLSTDGSSPVDFVFAGDPDEFHKTDPLDNESVRMYRVQDGEVLQYDGPGNGAIQTAKVGFGNGLQLEYETASESGTGEDYRATVSVELNTIERNTNTVSMKGQVSVPDDYSIGPGRFNYTAPDLDLVAIDSQGRRVGVTESGEFVNEIPGATASGDTNGMEWITVPEDADVEFRVRTDDVEAFMNQTNVSSENVTVDFQTAVTHVGSEPTVTQQDGAYTVTNATTEVTANRSVDPGTTSSAVNQTVIAGFNVAPNNPHPNRTVTVDGSLSTALNGSIERYEWTFENGTTVTGETISRVYTESGTYTLSLTVTDSRGHTASTTKTFRVADRPPTARLTVLATDPVAGQRDVVLSATESTDFIGITEFRWDVDGDGTVERVTDNATTRITPSYEEAGTYEPTVIAVDAKGQTDSASRTITVDAPENTDGSAGVGTTGGDDTADQPSTADSPVAVRSAGPGTTFVVSGVESDGSISMDVPERARHPSAPAEITALNLTLSETDGQFRLTVSAPAEKPPGSVPPLGAGSPMIYVNVTTNASDSMLTQASVRLDVSEDALPDGTSPENVTLYRYYNGSWRALETSYLGDGRYVATTPGFSAFALGAPTASTPTPTMTDVEPTATPTTTDVEPTATLTPTSTPTALTPTTTPSAGSGAGFGVGVTLLAVLCSVVIVRRVRD